MLITRAHGQDAIIKVRERLIASFIVVIPEMARIILISFEQKIEEKRLDVEFIAERDKMMANGDADAIHQVLYNLCHNA